MGSQVKKVLLQGIWGSLTGGWYFDPRHSKFTNVFHLYTWLILMILPFIFYMIPVAIPSWGSICSYTATVFAIFASIKVVNYRLHETFDKGEVVKREVEPTESDIGNNSVSSPHGDLGEIAGSRLTAADLFPIHNAAELPEKQNNLSGAGDGNSKVVKEGSEDGNNVKPVAVSDVGVDVHAAPVDLFQAETNNNKDNVAVKRTKRHRVRRQKRSHTEPTCMPHHRERKKKKSVAFAEVSGHTEKARNVSRCVSLPSATSDSEDETDSYGSNSTSDSAGTSDSLHNDNRAGNVLRVKRSERPQRRRAVRGHRHQPWHGHESRRKKLRIKNVTRVNECSCESSDADNEFMNMEGGKKDENKLHGVAAKKDTSDGQALLEEKINQNAEIVQRPDVDKTASIKNDKASMEAEKELPTSDQELLSKDPIWQAQRSQRYSSNRRPFFRRRSYTVNSLRQVTPVEETRRGSFTVPPYNGRTFSSPRPTPSSLKKLLSLWTREQNPSINEIVPSSPGEVSPGEVRLTGLSVDNSHLPNMPVSSAIGEESVATSEAADKNGPKTDNNTSRNSNPHFSETHTPERKAEENKKKVLVTEGSHHKKHKPKKAARSKSSGATRTTDESLHKSQLKTNEEAMFDLFNQKRPDTPIPGDGLWRDLAKLDLTSSDSDNDMYEFVNKLIGDREVWQGSENCDDHNASTVEASSTTKCSRHRTTSLPAQSIGNDNLLDPTRLNESLEGQLKEPQPGDVWHSRTSTASGSGTRTVSQSSRGRRVRHPAGESHSRLASNTSEEGSAATTSRQLSATHIAENSDGAALDNLPPTIVEKLKGTGEAPGAHIATEHNDTSTGAVHAFQDEHGNWLSYTFGESSGTAQILATNAGHNNRISRSFTQRHISLGEGHGSSDDITRNRPRHRFQIASLRRHHNLPTRGMDDLSAYLESDDISGSLNHADWQDMTQMGLMLDRPAITRRRPTTPKVKLSYKFQLLPFKSIILRYDRLSLLDLLDRNRHIIENLLAVFLAMIVAVLGLLLLQKGFFLDIWTLWFCVVIATAQYSLVNSVQPDSASPTHGHNHVIAYSRPIYFCILALLVLLFDYLGSGQIYVPDTYIYADLYLTKASCLVARNILIVFIKVLPFAFLLGLLPQIDTFVMYVLEQTEIHMFGGSACNSLPSALFSLTRSIVFSLCLFGFCYGGMKTPKESQNLLFSVFCGLLVSVSYHLSRQTNDPLHVWNIIRAKFLSCKNENTAADADTENGTLESLHDNPDELSSRYVNQVLNERLQSDLIVCPLLAIFAFAIHCSTAFTVLQPALSIVLYILAGVFGFTLHYLLPQLRKNLPWLLFSSPILKAKEYGLFEVVEEAQIMWFERAFVRLTFIERNFIYPLVIMNQLTVDAGNVVSLYGLVWGCVVLTFVGLKLLRSSYAITLMHYAALVFSLLYIKYDTRNSNDSILVTYFLTTILFVKFQDLMLKLQFIYVYIAPWQITWGSTFHAFAQPISVPHSGMLLINTVISSLLHAPLAPFLGSAIFLSSYMRPLKFWEKNYKTRRVDHSNTRLAAQIDRGPSTDDNNLNSLFYEHLTLALQKSLCGDIEMGRWGNVYPGDCFVMTSDYLNALVHIIQIGNGVINFQVRGLEFSGTYCQQREVEAISETIHDKKCCCCSVGHPRNMLSFNMALQRRWLAWQIQTKNFVLDGYSITDISATSMLGVYDLRKVLLSYMVKSVVYFLIMHDSLEKWLHDEGIKTAISSCEVQHYVDVDTSFSVTIHEDYDMWLSGISRTKFEAVYGRWVQHCASKRTKAVSNEDESKLVTLCFMVSILCRRALGTASVNLTANHVAMESFMYGLHSLFKGDFRITSSKDEWIFNDMELLHNVVVPGVRMAVKLHLDHFQNMDEDDQDWDGLYSRISHNMDGMVITHEGDPEWRKAVLSNRESLLALRHLAGDSVDSYFVVTLRKRCQGFLVVRINRESVKGLWAGQQQELVFLRNSNPERGSIQNAKQVLRNMINSSCDQPIGYPIYVSPVTTSFSNTHPSYKKIAGRSMSFEGIRNTISNLWTCLVQSCAAGCNSGGSVGINLGHVDHIRAASSAPTPPQVNPPPIPGPRPSVADSLSSGSYTPMADQIDPLATNRISKHSSHRSVSIDGSGGGRLSIEELTQQVPPPWSRSSATWRSVFDGGKGHSHSMSVNGSSEMSLLKRHSLRTRNSQKEGIDTMYCPSHGVVVLSSRPSIASEDLQPSNLPTPKEGRKNSNTDAAATMGSENSSGSGHLTEALPKSTIDASATKSTDRVRSRSQQGKKGAKTSRSRQTDPKEYAKITDPSRVLGTLEIQRRVDHVKWPNDEWRKFGGKSKWGDWTPTKDTVGEIVFRWYPNHRDPSLRSHIGEVILLLRVKSESSKNPFYVPIPEKCTSPHKPEIETTQL